MVDRREAPPLPSQLSGASCCLDIGATMERTKGVTMAEIEETKPKGADAKVAKTEAAPIHETQNEQETVPEHIKGTSETPKEISEAIVNPPKPNEDEVKGEDNSPIADPHSADPQADPKGRSSRNAEDVIEDETDDDGRLKLARVSGDDVYGNLGAPGSTVDQLKEIRDRESARSERKTGES